MARCYGVTTYAAGTEAFNLQTHSGVRCNLFHLGFDLRCDPLRDPDSAWLPDGCYAIHACRRDTVCVGVLAGRAIHRAITVASCLHDGFHSSVAGPWCNRAGDPLGTVRTRSVAALYDADLGGSAGVGSAGRQAARWTRQHGHSVGVSGNPHARRHRRFAKR